MVVWFRRSARRLAASWLCGQLAMLALAAIALGPVPAGAARHCECPGSPEAQTCPMHHGSVPAPLADRQCAMRHSNATDVTVIAVATGFSPSPRFSIAHGLPISSPLAMLPVLSLDRSSVPEAPPPRL